MLHITVELRPDGIRDLARTVATAEVTNVSDVAHLDDYQVHATEGANPLTGTPEWEAAGRILDHDRHSSVWSLVARVADWAAEQAKR